MKTTTIALSLSLVLSGCLAGPHDDRPLEVKAAAEALKPVTTDNVSRERADYLSKIELRNVAVGAPRTDVLSERNMLASLEVKNRGDRTLERSVVLILVTPRGQPGATGGGSVGWPAPTGH